MEPVDEEAGPISKPVDEEAGSLSTKSPEASKTETMKYFEAMIEVGKLAALEARIREVEKDKNLAVYDNSSANAHFEIAHKEKTAVELERDTVKARNVELMTENKHLREKNVEFQGKAKWSDKHKDDAEKWQHNYEGLTIIYVQKEKEFERMEYRNKELVKAFGQQVSKAINAEKKAREFQEKLEKSNIDFKTIKKHLNAAARMLADLSQCSDVLPANLRERLDKMPIDDMLQIGKPGAANSDDEDAEAVQRLMNTKPVIIRPRGGGMGRGSRGGRGRGGAFCAKRPVVDERMHEDMLARKLNRKDAEGAPAAPSDPAAKSVMGKKTETVREQQERQKGGLKGVIAGLKKDGDAKKADSKVNDDGGGSDIVLDNPSNGSNDVIDENPSIEANDMADPVDSDKHMLDSFNDDVMDVDDVVQQGQQSDGHAVEAVAVPTDTSVVVSSAPTEAVQQKKTVEVAEAVVAAGAPQANAKELGLDLSDTDEEEDKKEEVDKEKKEEPKAVKPLASFSLLPSKSPATSALAVSKLIEKNSAPTTTVKKSTLAVSLVPSTSRVVVQPTSMEAVLQRLNEGWMDEVKGTPRRAPQSQARQMPKKASSSHEGSDDEEEKETRETTPPLMMDRPGTSNRFALAAAQPQFKNPMKSGRYEWQESGTPISPLVLAPAIVAKKKEEEVVKVGEESDDSDEFAPPPVPRRHTRSAGPAPEIEICTVGGKTSVREPITPKHAKKVEAKTPAKSTARTRAKSSRTPAKATKTPAKKLTAAQRRAAAQRTGVSDVSSEDEDEEETVKMEPEDPDYPESSMSRGRGGRSASSGRKSVTFAPVTPHRSMAKTPAKSRAKASLKTPAKTLAKNTRTPAKRAAAAQKSEDQNDEEAAAPQKRGRGRPRKVQPAEQSADEPVMKEEPVDEEFPDTARAQPVRRVSGAAPAAAAAAASSSGAESRAHKRKTVNGEEAPASGAPDTKRKEKQERSETPKQQQLVAAVVAVCTEAKTMESGLEDIGKITPSMSMEAIAAGLVKAVTELPLDDAWPLVRELMKTNGQNMEDLKAAHKSEKLLFDLMISVQSRDPTRLHKIFHCFFEEYRRRLLDLISDTTAANVARVVRCTYSALALMAVTASGVNVVSEARKHFLPILTRTPSEAVCQSLVYLLCHDSTRHFASEILKTDLTDVENHGRIISMHMALSSQSVDVLKWAIDRFADDSCKTLATAAYKTAATREMAQGWWEADLAELESMAKNEQNPIDIQRETRDLVFVSPHLDIAGLDKVPLILQISTPAIDTMLRVTPTQIVEYLSARLGMGTAASLVYLTPVDARVVNARLGCSLIAIERLVKDRKRGAEHREAIRRQLDDAIKKVQEILNRPVCNWMLTPASRINKKDGLHVGVAALKTWAQKVKELLEREEKSTPASGHSSPAKKRARGEEGDE